MEAVDDTNRKSQILVHKYKKEIQLRKKLHNTLIELQGNIRVLCRVRPIIREDGADCVNMTSFNDDDSAIVYVNHKNTMRKFEMDRVFKPEATQTEVDWFVICLRYFSFSAKNYKIIFKSGN